MGRAVLQKSEKFIADDALAPLKAFQRRTVDYVFDRLYGTNNVQQFLVADEVGLGKTMVARGLIARVIEHLWETTPRIDIIYICSNQAIAAQNLNRLNVLGRRELALPTRMTLIPLQLRGSEAALDKNRVNFVSLTPGTTFDLRSSTGVVQERAFLRRLLETIVSRPRGLHNLLQVHSSVENWNYEVDRLSLDGVDKRIINRFRHDVRSDKNLFSVLQATCEQFARRRQHYPADWTVQRNQLVARLRAKLSRACVEALQPDLIILDEFQRFRDLLHGDSDAAVLARELFDYCEDGGIGARTLLLSATPYRMLTLATDGEEEGDHHAEFLETIEFLFGPLRGPEIVKSIAREMTAFRALLQQLPESHGEACGAREGLEEHLRQVMARTERISSTQQRDAMVSEPPMEVSVQPHDITEARAVAQLARVLDAPEIVEYWKSCPYLLNFMRGYVLKNELKERIGRPTAALRDALRAIQPTMLSRAKLHIYSEIAPPNGRMRAMLNDIFSQGLERHLWIAPSLPYYGEQPADPPLTKALVFSAWQMVPDAIAALLSYEAERRMDVAGTGRTYFDQKRLQPLNFRQDHGRLTGLRALLLIYPSPSLASGADPLSIFQRRGEQLSERDMRAELADWISALISKHQPGVSAVDGAETQEWAAPAVLDARAGFNLTQWLTDPSGFSVLAEDAFHEHAKQLRSAAEDGDIELADQVDLLVDVALGSPAVCALRALHRVAPDLAWDNPCLLDSAAKVAWGFRTLFNQPDAIALLRSGSEDRYWHRVLTFCAENNLQAVLDEYAHYLVDAEGIGSAPDEERVRGIAEAMARALSIRPSQIEVDDITVNGGTMSLSSFQMRGRFAMRLSDYKDEDGAVARIGGVRDAFNSPFRPFVLATTSIGQEGLDFHPYCYRLYHWNLPGNPVDLEQREGRIHRFKGHAIRLNLASRQRSALHSASEKVIDPWQFMFDKARSESLVQSDLVPYWIYEGPTMVERRVPILPFSREVTRLEWLKRSLTVYRLAFGQPRQEDLLNYLQERVANMSAEDLAGLQIQLEPPSTI